MAKIIIADDDIDILNILSMLLGEAGHEVIEATSGEQALQSIQQNHPDLLLIDYHMPPGDSSGLVTIMKLRDMGFTRPIIMMTADRSQQIAVQSMREKINDFIPKPFDGRDLLAHVNRALNDHCEQESIAHLLDALSKLHDRAVDGGLAETVEVIDAGKLIARMQ